MDGRLRLRRRRALTGVVSPNRYIESVEDAPIAPESRPGLRKLRPGDQDYPDKNDLPSMHEQARRDLEARKAIGIQRYGVALQPANGRDAARDLYEEVLDAAAYAAQVTWEQENPEHTFVGALIDAVFTGQLLDFQGRFVPEGVQRYIEERYG